MMKRLISTFIAAALAFEACAAWYWPFGGKEEQKPLRMSELMEAASVLVDNASDLAMEGKIPEAVAEYQKALAELERLEIEHPERAATSEFSTVRNKKAYVAAAIDSLLLEQATKNARAVAITDTTDLEKKYARELAGRNVAGEPAEAEVKTPPVRPLPKTPAVVQLPPVEGVATNPAPVKAEQPAFDPRQSKLVLAGNDFRKKDYAAAMLAIKEILNERPDDAGALNLKALVEMAQGNAIVAEETLHSAIRYNPKSHHAYYNLAKLILKTRGQGGKDEARRYYDNARKFCNGPEDKTLEEALK